MTEEIWKQIVGYDGDYRVSNYGRVMSFVQHPEGREKATYLNRGYPIVNLILDGKTKHLRLHRIVCEAFHGPCPPGHETAHLDGDRQNARADNLAWKTPKENGQDKIRHGTSNAGENSPQSRLNSSQVFDIRRRKLQGERTKELAQCYGIAVSTCAQVINGSRWKHLPPPKDIQG